MDKSKVQVNISLEEYEELLEFRNLKEAIEKGIKFINLYIDYNQSNKRSGYAFPSANHYIRYKELDENDAIALLEEKVAKLEGSLKYSKELNDFAIKKGKEHVDKIKKLEEKLNQPFWKRLWKIS